MACKLALIFAGGLLIFGVWQCSDVDNPFSQVEPRELSRAEQQLVTSDNSFGLKLFREIVAEQPDKNVFISPLSVAMALTMTYNGANGTTKDAMEETLELQGLSLEEINESYQTLIELLTQLDPQVTFTIANSLWYKEDLPFEEDFIGNLRESYGAAVEGVDFHDPATVEVVNAWVKDNTNGKIAKIIDTFPPEIAFALLNALYFKGNWTCQFDPEYTRDDQFQLLDGSTVDCRMMMKEEEHRVFWNPSFVALDLPYGRELYSMTLILPRPESNFDSLLAQLTPENWDSWIGSFHGQKTMVQLPKFKVEYELKMNDILTRMGMGIIFEREADFTNLCPCQIWIDEVRHKTYIDVDEEGTEAAAVTSEIGVTGMPRSFRFDRPFIFAIREKSTGAILFMGRIVKPEYEES